MKQLENVVDTILHALLLFIQTLALHKSFTYLLTHGGNYHSTFRICMQCSACDKNEITL